MKRISKILVAVLALVLMMSVLVACGSTNTAEAKYWFSAVNKETIAYSDADGGNLDKAGTYWRMTVKKDMKVDIAFVCDVDDTFSSSTLKVNGTKVLRDAPDVQNVVYKGLDLKKGDELEFYSFWVNSVTAASQNEGFSISMFTITLDGVRYIVEDIT